MEQEKYLKDRVDEQIAWYDRKSSIHKWWHLGIRTTEIGMAATISFLSGYVKGWDWAPLAIGILAVLIIVAEGIRSLFKYHENWLHYRSTCEALKNEKNLFLNKAGIYATLDNSNADSGSWSTFVERIEFLIAKENSHWQQVASKSDKKS